MKEKFEYKLLHTPLTLEELKDGKLNRKVNYNTCRSIDFSKRKNIYHFILIDNHNFWKEFYFSIFNIENKNKLRIDKEIVILQIKLFLSCDTHFAFLTE